MVDSQGYLQVFKMKIHLLNIINEFKWNLNKTKRCEEGEKKDNKKKYIL